jgi:hypothetical protein
MPDARIATPEDNALLTSIVMHPACRMWTTHDAARFQPFDPQPYTDPESPHLAVLVNDGAFLLPFLAFGAYAVHTQFVPKGRGENAERGACALLDLMFSSTPAEQLVTMVPDNNPMALRFAHQRGFKNTYRRERCWQAGGKSLGMQYMRLDIDEWVTSTLHLRSAGQAFHEMLGPEHVSHEEDPIHDAYVGAALAMIRAGHAKKAEWIYTRWGRAAGYEPFRLIDETTIEVGDMRVAVDANTITLEYANA